MKPFAIAALCGGLAIAPLVAKAAELVLYDGTGRPVAVLVPVSEAAAMPAFPADVFAQQDAILGRMMQSMRTMDAAFSPGNVAIDPASLGGQPGSTVIMTSFSDGRSSCSRTVMYDQRGGGAPIVQVRQTGAGCGALPAVAHGSTLPVAVPEAVPERVAPMRRTNFPNMIRVDYLHPVTKPVARHS